MTQEEKSLLLQDLCERSLHGVMCDRLGQTKKLLSVSPGKEYCIELDNGEYTPNEYKVEDIKPYLRPLSSATEKEMEEFEELFVGYSISQDRNCVYRSSRGDLNLGFIDWLITHQFDYRGLIPMGLALPATEGMYKF